MEVQAYLNKMKNLQNSLLLFLENESDQEEHFQNFIQLFDESKIKEEPSDFKIFIQLISKISENNLHLTQYFSRLQKVISHIKEEIKQTLSNQEIFQIFRLNNKILLFLIDSNIIVIDEPLIKSLYSVSTYLPFFFPEFKPFLSEMEIENYSKQIPENFEEKKKIGENDNYICQLIRNDDINEFITYVNKTNYPIDSKLKESIFETNRFISSKTTRLSGSSSLIEYAAFFGSVQIFKYLYLHNVQMKPNLLLYSIHGANPEIIHILEGNKSLFDEQKKKRFSIYDDFSVFDLIHNYDDYLSMHDKHPIREKCLIEAIYCHRNDIALYISSNWFKTNQYSLIRSKSFKSFNFNFIENINGIDDFYYLCKYNYYKLANLFLKSKEIDVNQKTIQNILFF